MINHWLYVMFTFTFIFEGLLIYGAYRTLIGQTMSLSQLAVITSMMVSTTWILIGFTDSLTNLVKNGLFIEYLRTFLEYKEKIPENMEGANPGKTIRSIEFRDVSFSYKDKEVLSHRLSTTRDADRIILLENGKIVEEGTHDSLLALNGKYAEMWNVQAGRYKEAV